ncbi:hypothetical protein [Burkholderia gladioli]|uniref:hypothetical protein n=1 Tax=Burkholderia gladioli TaxID=28095 RepID=UPI003D215D64
MNSTNTTGTSGTPGASRARRQPAAAAPRVWRIRYSGTVELEIGRIARSEHRIEFDQEA